MKRSGLYVINIQYTEILCNIFNNFHLLSMFGYLEYKYILSNFYFVPSLYFERAVNVKNMVMFAIMYSDCL